jgi:hypothetical protein
VSPLHFAVVDARPEPHAATPTLLLRLRVTAAGDEPVHAVALRCQIMIEPQRRRHEREEQDLLTELFGEAPRWGDTLRPFLWTNVGTTLTGFTGSTEIDLAVPCTYDMEVAAAKYFHSLGGGEVPIVLLFSGTVFTRGTSGLGTLPIAWHEEAAFRLPVSVWRAVIDMYFPNSGWLRLDVDSLAALQRFRRERALLSWDATVAALLKEAGAAP